MEINGRKSVTIKKYTSFLLTLCIVFSMFSCIQMISATTYDPKETDCEEYLLMKYYEIFRPEKLPEQHKSLESFPTMSATALISEIRENWNKLSSQARGELGWTLQRPVDASGGWDSNQHLLPKLYTSPDGNFVIHWTNGSDGGLAVDAPPMTDSDGDDVPDYIENFAGIFDHVWATEITNPTYGYHQPPSDAAESNENSRNPNYKYDVFVYELNGYAYGYTDPEEKSIIHQHGSSYSYIAVDNDYVGFPGTQMDCMQVTAAHEFFHAIQFYYDCGEETWWMETTAVWMEDEVYDSVNDYLQYIPGWLSNPHLSLTLEDGSHEYGNCIFAKFLAENQGKDVIKDIWEEMVSTDGVTAIDDILRNNYNTDFESVFRDFTVVNYLNSNNNHDGDFTNDQYEEGDLYDDIHHRDVSVPATFSQENPVQEYASEYIEITPPREMTISFDGNWLTNFIVRVLKIDGSAFTIETMNLNWQKDGSIEIPTTHDRIVLVIAREDDLLGDGTYTVRVSAIVRVDVALVIDRSGSMLGSKIASAKISAKLFTDLMQIRDRIGVVSYATSAGVNYGLTEITTTATKTAAKNAIDGIYASGMTAMGRGLRTALNQLVSYGDSSHPWAIVLMSNGFHNTGEHPYSVIPDLTSRNIRVYTIGLGAGADGNLLGHIASQTGGFYRYSPTAAQLLEIYNDIAAAVTQSQTVSSAQKSVAQDQTSQSSASIDSSITQATFTISWGGSDLDLTLTRPDGLVIDPSVAATDPNIEFVEEAQYEFYRIDGPMPGIWAMTVIGVDVPMGTEDFVAKVTAITSVTLTVNTDKDSYVYPEPIHISATIRDGGLPITGAVVQATIRRPDTSQVGTDLFDDGSASHGDVAADDGIYTNYFTTFNEDGSYTIHVKASGSTFTGEDFTREDQKTVLVSGAPADTTPPKTNRFIDSPQYIDAVGNVYITSNTPIIMTAVDNNGAGSGVADTRYRVYNATYDTGWIVSVPPITFQLTDLEDGSYCIEYYSTDNAGNAETTNAVDIILDNTGPEITVLSPPAGWALQDGVTFIASAVDSCGVVSLNFSIREDNGGDGIPVGFEDLPATYNSVTGEWRWSFDTLLLPDGYYLLLVRAIDNLGNIGSTIVPYSIRNWAVLELLPASKDNKAGRTMPVKFALRVATEVDPNQPFVYNEELRIEICSTDNPAEILQESHFGNTARDYRISSVLYITNFKTLKRPIEYIVTVYRDTFDVDSFVFETTK